MSGLPVRLSGVAAAGFVGLVIAASPPPIIEYFEFDVAHVVSFAEGISPDPQIVDARPELAGAAFDGGQVPINELFIRYDPDSGFADVSMTLQVKGQFGGCTSSMFAVGETVAPVPVDADGSARATIETQWTWTSQVLAGGVCFEKYNVRAPWQEIYTIDLDFSSGAVSAAVAYGDEVETVGAVAGDEPIAAEDPEPVGTSELDAADEDEGAGPGESWDAADDDEAAAVSQADGDDDGLARRVAVTGAVVATGAGVAVTLTRRRHMRRASVEKAVPGIGPPPAKLGPIAYDPSDEMAMGSFGDVFVTYDLAGKEAGVRIGDFMGAWTPGTEVWSVGVGEQLTLVGGDGEYTVVDEDRVFDFDDNTNQLTVVLPGFAAQSGGAGWSVAKTFDLDANNRLTLMAGSGKAKGAVLATQISPDVSLQASWEQWEQQNALGAGHAHTSTIKLDVGQVSIQKARGSKAIFTTYTTKF